VKNIIISFCVLLNVPLGALAIPDAVEISAAMVAELPGGKEADGIIGDFLLRNDRIEAVISANLPLRRANMSTFYGASGITPGNLYDITLRGQNNDQITIFSPLRQQGAVSWVRIAKDGSDGEAIIETMVTDAVGKGMAGRHEYILRDGWRGVLIRSTITNKRDKEEEIKLEDYRKPIGLKGSVKGVIWGDAVDPADHGGHAYAWISKDGVVVPKVVILPPGQSLTVERFVAVGNSPAEAVGNVWAHSGETGTLKLRMTEAGGEAITSGRVMIDGVPGYPDAEGQISVSMLPGKVALTFEDMGRESVTREVDVAAGAEASVEVMMTAASAFVFDCKDGDGKSIPCKVQVIGADGTATPDYGPQNRAHGCANQYHSEVGKFRLQTDIGKYQVIVTHGPEFDHHEQVVELAAGQEVKIAAVLKRSVSTPGWVSTDYHNHSTPSGDNQCGTDDRIINLAAEQIEFAPTTEHNRLYDWSPHIEKLGLTAELQTVSGMELTGGGAHLNTFPLKPEPRTQDGGAPVWQKDPRLNAIVLRNFQNEEPDRWIHVNHPDMAENFVDWNHDGRPDGGYLHFGSLIDGLETQNFRASGILADAPFVVGKELGPKGRVQYVREFIWLQLLNKGLQVWGIAVSDAHSVFGNGVGGWRTYVKSSTDTPQKIDWSEMSRHSKSGHMILSNGPFLEVTAGDGAIAGETIRHSASLPVKVKVQCPSWLDIDRVQVLVNSAKVPELNFTRESHPEWFADGVVKFDRTIDVPLSQDCHIIVVAFGENFDLAKGFGISDQAQMNPCAYNNPIFVDVDGGGFSPNGDTLGYPLPVAGLTPDQARKILGE
jgi:hypothetical protein